MGGSMRVIIKIWMFLLAFSFLPVGVYLFLMTIAWSHPGSRTGHLYLLPLGMGIAIWGCSMAVRDGFVSWNSLLLTHIPLFAFLIWARFF